MNENRKKREATFHDNRFGGESDIRDPISKYYSIMHMTLSAYEALILKYCENGQLLEYGCGTGSNSAFWGCNAKITGIDISQEGIAKAKEAALRSGQDIDYYVMDAENLQFEDNSFDVVIGLGILHHLDLKEAGSELSRVLREDGHAVFIEPLGHNPIINMYRKFTPSMRSEDEHPLLMRDIEFLEQYFSTVKARYFHIFTLLAVPFRKTKVFERLLALLSAFDTSLMRIMPFAKRYAWTVLLDLSMPRKIS
jgi:SAM-dependent methyltransferase